MKNEVKVFTARLLDDLENNDGRGGAASTDNLSGTVVDYGGRKPFLVSVRLLFPVPPLDEALPSRVRCRYDHLRENIEACAEEALADKPLQELRARTMRAVFNTKRGVQSILACHKRMTEEYGTMDFADMSGKQCRELIAWARGLKG